jgi:hypothetical protein
MARIDEIAEGLASVLRSSPVPEPLGVDLWNETPAAATVLVRAVIDTCLRNAIPLSLVRICPDLGKGLLRQLTEDEPAYEGVQIISHSALSQRIEFFRFAPPSES